MKSKLFKQIAVSIFIVSVIGASSLSIANSYYLNSADDEKSITKVSLSTVDEDNLISFNNIFNWAEN